MLFSSNFHFKLSRLYFLLKIVSQSAIQLLKPPLHLRKSRPWRANLPRWLNLADYATLPPSPDSPWPFIPYPRNPACAAARGNRHAMPPTPLLPSCEFRGTWRYLFRWKIHPVCTGCFWKTTTRAALRLLGFRVHTVIVFLLLWFLTLPLTCRPHTRNFDKTFHFWTGRAFMLQIRAITMNRTHYKT